MRTTGSPALSIAADALVLFATEEDLSGRGRGPLASLDRALSGELWAAVGAERFAGKVGQALTLTPLGKIPARRLTLLGLGPGEKMATAARRGGHEPLRAAAGRAARDAVKAGASSLALTVPPLPSGGVPGAARALVEGALLGAYSFERYRKKEEDRPPGLALVEVAVPAAALGGGELSRAVALAREVAAAVAWARDLVNLGPADCTPTRLAEAAAGLARRYRLKVKVRGRREIEALGMGLFLGVSSGSAEPPRLVQVSYSPRGAAARRPPLVLVGKAITFDSGGLSLKPTESMVTMHTDMAGSAAVLGAMRVVASLRPAFPVHAVLGACENMPGGRAYKPSDVLRAFDGQTVEVVNTDAEGRLVLGDVLAWAARAFRPEGMVDVATLTGACVVALGQSTAGLFGPDGKLVEAVAAAARAAGEDVWRMPLTEALEDQLKSDRADLKNAGERWGGAITAAHFLHRFAGEVPWAHLDIAGPARAPKDLGYLSSGGTGFGVRTLVELVRAWG
ncbi:MAG TPA: leucyl aminopeptidase [Anaeromyxobacter sp.]|nr:leucyl aminopeptidase [Anaeromyxobacter sp.]